MMFEKQCKSSNNLTKPSASTLEDSPFSDTVLETCQVENRTVRTDPTEADSISGKATDEVDGKLVAPHKDIPENPEPYVSEASSQLSKRQRTE